MGKRYYCDFCDKTFPYNTANRKKHNEGLSHQQARNAYYAKYKDLETILAEEREKKPCYKYLTSGYCAFGLQCRCSHKTPQEMQYLENLYKYECHKKAVKEELKQKETNKKKHKKQSEFKSLISENLNREEIEVLEKVLPSFEMPQSLLKYNGINLPVSLIPPSYKDLIDFDLKRWSTEPF